MRVGDVSSRDPGSGMASWNAACACAAAGKNAAAAAAISTEPVSGLEAIVHVRHILMLLLQTALDR